MRGISTDVLIVGAGPVGLWTALLLAEAGVDVAVIDRENRTAARDYACGLHPRTLSLFQTRGLAEAVLDQARRVPKLAFYEGTNRQAELDLAKLGGEYPFLAILPQHALESLLEQQLRKAGVLVQWQHQFVDLSAQEESVRVEVEKLAGTSTGYIVPHWETTVESRFELNAQFLLGADGQGSRVRERAGIHLEAAGLPAALAAYEFETDGPVENEIRVVLDNSGASVLWPLADHKCRWAFSIAQPQGGAEFPFKERRAVRLAQPDVDEQIRQFIQRQARERAPWFAQSVSQILWSARVTFQQRVAARFGQHRCWLAGDAAHQTGPVGVQSMNLGFVEGLRLSQLLPRALRGPGSLETLSAYNQESRSQWLQLLGLSGELKPRPTATPWIRAHAAAIRPCIPGADGDFNSLAAQLGLAWAD